MQTLLPIWPWDVQMSLSVASSPVLGLTFANLWVPGLPKLPLRAMSSLQPHTSWL